MRRKLNGKLYVHKVNMNSIKRTTRRSVTIKVERKLSMDKMQSDNQKI